MSKKSARRLWVVERLSAEGWVPVEWPTATMTRLVARERARALTWSRYLKYRVRSYQPDGGRG